MMTEVRRGYQMPRNWSYSGNNPLHMSARNQILALWKTVKYSYPPLILTIFTFMFYLQNMTICSVVTVCSVVLRPRLSLGKGSTAACYALLQCPCACSYLIEPY